MPAKHPNDDRIPDDLGDDAFREGPAPAAVAVAVELVGE